MFDLDNLANEAEMPVIGHQQVRSSLRFKANFGEEIKTCKR